MINIKNKFDCCGCEACAQVCTRHAISMLPDSQGFLYPKVDSSLCNDCGLCEKNCPLLKTYEERIPIHTYAVKNKNEDIRMKSSSGGVFTILAEDTISKGGVVYGAVFDNDWNVVHDRIDNIADIERLRGSKYVQSRMDGIYPRVKKDLQAGIPVLFSGCHCHIAALLLYLRKKYVNLITVDVVCGGVPSPRIWRDYLNEELTAHRAAVGGSTVSSSLNAMPLIKGIKFRDKSQGWRKYRFDLLLAEASADGEQSTVSTSYNTYIWQHTFMLPWLKQYITRPSCNRCCIRAGRSGSDCSIADYWNIGSCHKEFSDDIGVSLFMDYRGDFINIIKDRGIFIETEYSSATKSSASVLKSHPYNRFSGLYYFSHDYLRLNLKHSLYVTEKIENAICLLVYVFNKIQGFFVRTSK